MKEVEEVKVQVKEKAFHSLVAEAGKDANRCQQPKQ